jgi:hypothetical protein
MQVSIDQLKDTTTGRRRKIVIGVIFVSILVHTLGGMGAAVWIVARYLTQPEATFQVKKAMAIAPQIIDPKMAAAEFEAAAPKPQLDQKIASLRETNFALPDVPMADVDDTVQFDPSTIANSAVEGLSDAFGSGGNGGGGGGNGTGFSFFGLQQQTQRVVFVIDISGSMVMDGKGPEAFDKLQKEVENALRGMGPNGSFSIVAFAGDTSRFHGSLITCTPDNIDRAMKWLTRYSPAEVVRENGGKIPTNWTPIKNGIHSGTRAEAGLEDGFKLNPDLIVFVSDGEPSLNVGKAEKKSLENGEKITKPEQIHPFVQELQAKQGKPITISAISYKADSGQAFMKKLATDNGGGYRDVK